MKAFFHASDFEELYDLENFIDTYGSKAALIANNILNKHLESLRVVYSADLSYKYAGSRIIFYDQPSKDCTHKARLFGIEEIKKEPCKHEPMGYYDLNGTKHIDAVKKESRCTFCGVELVATWSEKK